MSSKSNQIPYIKAVDEITATYQLYTQLDLLVANKKVQNLFGAAKSTRIS